MLRIFTLLSFLLGLSFWKTDAPTALAIPEPNYDHLAYRWVDSMLATLDLDAQIGQLMMIRAHSDLGPKHEKAVEQLITNYKVGGLCFFQGTPDKQVELTNRYQRLSKVPLLVAMDAEWGLNMRLKTLAPFPYQLTMGAVQNDSLIYAAGQAIGQQCKRLGVHVNFGPVADVNNNPKNPVINFRSFGENQALVAQKSIQFFKGMQSRGVIGCAKHFPGHGDTDIDSHYDLPRITHSLERLKAVELRPFREMIAQNVPSIMIAHLEVPALEQEKHVPTSLSKNTVTTLLRETYGYDGLVFTDGLEMKGVTKHFGNGEVEARAIAAGNDVLLLPESVPDAFAAIHEYLKAGKLDSAAISEHCRRVLRAKYEAGLTATPQVETYRLAEDLEPSTDATIRDNVYAEAITVVRNANSGIPITVNSDQQIALLSIGQTGNSPFAERVSAYHPVQRFSLPLTANVSQFNTLLKDFKTMDRIIIGLHDLKQYPRGKFGLSAPCLQFLNALAKAKPVTLVVFGNPYTLEHLPDAEQLVVAYEDRAVVQQLAAQILFGARGAYGKLPVGIGTRFPQGTGLQIAPLPFIMSHGTPESVGLDADTLFQIDTLVWSAIRNGSTPGAVVLVARNNRIVYHKAFGYHTYEQKEATRTDDVFDLASITKIAATTLGLMDLTQREKFHPEHQLSSYLPLLRGSNKAALKGTDVLSHQAQLHPWIPFFETTLIEERGRLKPSPSLYSANKKKGFAVEVANRLYLKTDYQEEIWRAITEVEMRPTKEYKYSDLGFYLFGRIISEQNDEPMDSYLRKQFYQKMGLHTMTFNPLRTISPSRIPPTEEDDYFRMQRLRGNVHDMGAAMFGGVAGNAGLFSSAEDLARLMNLFLDNGKYGDQQLLTPDVLQYYQTRPAGSTRRGLGFDMKELDETRSLNIAAAASERAFGHYGFTGTAVWADPDEDLIYVFLSNRTYPTMKNNALNKTDVRSRIQAIIYQALK